MNKKTLLILVGIVSFLPLKGQFWSNINVLGSFENNSAYYIKDGKLNYNQAESSFATNNYLKINLRYKFLEAGIQYENYLPPLLGYSQKLEGHRLAQRFLSYSDDTKKITVGNFFEQYGSGLILRTFEDRALGINTVLDGINTSWTLNDFFTIRLFGAKQLGYKKNGTSVIAGSSMQLNFSDLVFPGKTGSFRVGLNWVLKSRNKTEEEWMDNSPEKVNGLSGEIHLSLKNFSLFSEIAIKSDDPSQINGIENQKGKGFIINPSFSKKGIGINLNFRRLTRMDFRSENIMSDQFFMLNYIPANSKQHKYSLANLHPYAANPGNEFSVQADIFYLFPKQSSLGGKYGTKIALNFSQQYYSAIPVNFKIRKLISSENMVYRDMNVEIDKKWSRKLKTIFSFVSLNMENNVFVADNEPQKANIIVIDAQYKINSGNTLRAELQHLFAEKEAKNWYGFNAEYSFAPYWSFFVSDMVNYAGENIHYASGGVRVNIKSTTFQLSYGRNREGYKCSGGICRWMPAYSGLGFSLTSNF